MASEGERLVKPLRDLMARLDLEIERDASRAPRCLDRCQNEAPPEAAPSRGRRDVQLVEPRRCAAVLERPEERKHCNCDHAPAVACHEHPPELAVSGKGAYRA